MSDTHTKAVTVIEHSDDTRLHPMVRAFQTANADPATLRELLAIQRDWEAGEAKRAYTRALVALKRDLPTILGRDKRVHFVTSKGAVDYTHTSLAAVMTAVTEPLTAHGFSLGWEPSTEAQKVTVVCRLTHAEGHSETCTISAPVDTSGSKSPAQGVASTITLLQRYTALALLGLATADMVEPKRETDTSVVDTARNLRFVAEIRKAGKSLADAESVVGRKVDGWTLGDLDTLRCWISGGEVEELSPALAKARDLLGLETWQVVAIMDENGGDEEKTLAILREKYRSEKG